MSLLDPKKETDEKIHLLKRVEGKLAFLDSFDSLQAALQDARKEIDQIKVKALQEKCIAAETDYPNDCLLSETDFPGSCQNVNDDVESNKCLTAYLLDGKNKTTGRIHSRAILRILFDDSGNQGLFFEKIYPEKAPLEHQEALLALAVKKGKSNANPSI